MSEEDNSASTIDPAVVPAAIETAEPAKAEGITETTVTERPDAGKPAGYDPIDPKTATPEQTQERLDYLYRQLKPTQRENREMRNLLAEQSRIITELSEGQKAVVTHLTERGFADGEEQLKGAMRAAWAKGDNVAYIDAQAKLNRLYTQQEVLKLQQPQQPVQSNGHIPANATEVARNAVNSGDITEDEYRMTDAWQNERDQSGNLLRPWAHNNSPDYQFAWREAQAVFSNPKFTSYEQRLAEMDRRMGTSKPKISQSVIGGALTKPAKTAKIELSPKQREIALKSNYAGKGKSEAEHLDAYRKQIEKINQRRAK